MLKVINTPLLEKNIEDLQAGDRVIINGTIYTGRDAAHKKLINLLKDGEKLPFDVRGQIIYYVGPCPAKPAHVIGSAGPTTSGRMDVYTPLLLQKGLKGMIGKGQRNSDVIEAMKQEKAVYFAAIGGAGALLAKQIKEAEIVAFEELGPEAIYKLRVENFPVTVVIDSRGNNLYDIGKEKYQSLDAGIK